MEGKMKTLTVSTIVICVLVSAAVFANDKGTATVLKPTKTEKYKAKSETKLTKAKLQKIEKTQKMKFQKIEEKNKPKLEKKKENLEWKLLWQAYCKTCQKKIGHWNKQMSAAKGEKTAHLKLYPKHNVVINNNIDD